MKSKKVVALASAFLILCLAAVMVGDKFFFNYAGNLKDSKMDKLFAGPSSDGYQLVWYDEFEGTSLDSTKWRTDQTRMSNTDELFQTYASYVQTVSEGNLQMNAIVNPWYDPESEKSFEQHEFLTTGSITTENRMSYRYGYLEIRAKIPFKKGCWPGFWIRSHNATEKQVNSNFEIELDVFEVFGSTDTLASNLHQQGYNGKSYQTNASKINAAERHKFANPEDLSNEYHLYGFEWTPDKMAVYIDGELNCEWDLNEYALASYGLAPDKSGFDTTMNVLFNNHLFTASSDYKTSDDNIIENYRDNLPSEYNIDYVRLYQKNDGLSKLITGR